MENLVKDLRYALRTLRQGLGFTLIAVVTLALGIGATTAIFTLVKSVLLEPLPYPEPERLVVVMENNLEAGFSRFSISPPDFQDFRDQNRVFETIAVFRGENFNLTGEERAERLQGSLVSREYFRVMGVEPVLGRAFLPEEDKPGAPPVVVLNHGLWQRRFGGDRDVLGRPLLLDGESYTVVGVMPSQFSPNRELFVPLALDYAAGNRGNHFLIGMARLRPGVTPDEAQADLAAIAARLQEAYPDTNTGWGAVVDPLHELLVEDVRAALWILLAAVALVLLVGCANIANLLLARMALRDREVALRTALGAGRGRLLRQFLTENLVLALLGGLLGTALAFGITRTLVAVYADSIPRAESVALDAGVLLFALILSAATSLIFGLAPAWHASRPNLVASLKEGAGTQAGGTRRGFVRAALVFAEVAVALVLLIGAGLLIRSFERLLDVDPGFEPAGALTMELSLPEAKYSEPARRVVFFRQLLERATSLPGVEQAATVFPMPLTGSGYMLVFFVEGRPIPQPNQEPVGHIRVASPGYFRTMGIPLLRGRDFTAHDDADAPRVVLLNQRAVERYWGDQDPIGQRITFSTPDGDDTVWATVIGVVGDVHHEALNVETEPEIYRANYQVPTSGAILILRTATDPASLAAPLRSEVAALDPDLPLFNVRTLQELVDTSVAEPRFNASLLSLFAGLALLLAALGVYGLISYSVTQRVREVGVRLALGASRSHVLGLILRQGMLPVVIGVVAGLILALILTRLLASLVYGVSTLDPATFTTIPLLLAAVAAIACSIPALRATRVDPMAVLREE